MVEDTAWHPVMQEQSSTWSPATRTILRTFLGSPLKLWASVGHWLIWHFNLDLYTKNQKPRVRSPLTGGEGKVSANDGSEEQLKIDQQATDNSANTMSLCGCVR